jgi:hypothetical protein
MAYIGPAPASSIIATSDIEDGAVTSAKIAASVAIAKGGTGTTTAAGAFTALASSQATVGDGSAGAPAITSSTASADSGIYFPAADTIGMVSGGTEQFRFGSNPIPGGSKNSVINGNMLIAQRGDTTAMGSANGATYGGPDRFCVAVQTSPQGRGTVTQDSTVLAGSGQSKSYKFDCTTAESAVAAGEEIAIQYRFEGQDIQHWMYAQTNAVTLTLSFDFRSPKSGTHCVGFYALDDNEHYLVEFTVASADTFEHFDITVALATSGTDIPSDATEGFRITWPLVCGSTFHGTAGSWANGEKYCTSNQQNLLDNTANNIYLSGVQLEVGSVATDFAHEDIGTTLVKCQRYYFDWTATIANEIYGTGQNDNTTQCIWSFNYPTTMRAAPTFDSSAAATFVLAGKGAAIVCSAVGSDRLNINNCRIVHSVSSGLTAGECYNIQRDASDATYLTFNAEL